MVAVLVGVDVTAGVFVGAGAEGLEGLLVLDGQPRVKKDRATRRENIPKIRIFIEVTSARNGAVKVVGINLA